MMKTIFRDWSDNISDILLEEGAQRIKVAYNRGDFLQLSVSLSLFEE